MRRVLRVFLLPACVSSTPFVVRNHQAQDFPNEEKLIENSRHSAALLRGPLSYDYPKLDPAGATPLSLLGGSIVLPSRVRPLPSTTGDIEVDMESLVRSLQDEICSALLAVEGTGVEFHEDVWLRKEGGGGRSRVLQGGKVFEKAGVNVSTVHGILPPGAVAQMRSRPGRAAEALASQGASSPPLPFFACGISLVLHPHNPMAPSVHANYRLFRVKVEDKWVWWYGGGADLSPSYVFPEDATHFHTTLKAVCDRLHPTAYARFKTWADTYFFIPHRSERRGVGGVFFDDLDNHNVGDVSSAGSGGSEGGVDRVGGGIGMVSSESSPHKLLPFIAEAGRSFTHAYLPILIARMFSPYTTQQKEWQQLRRGRYVEFNLVHDRGTKFGLATPGARIESILMSLPLTARWEYQHSTHPLSPEAATEALLRYPVSWIRFN